MTATKPAPADPNRAIALAVDLLKDRKGVTVEQLAVYARVNRSQLYRKLKGETGWKATDIANLADYFGVQPGDLFAGADVLALVDASVTRQASPGDTRWYLSPPRRRRSRKVATHLALVPRAA